MTIKQERAAQLIQEIMGSLLMFEVTDPALRTVTVTEVRIDRELEYADIYVHSRDDKDAVMAGLERAGGFLRRELAARTSFRRTPVLHFHWDATIEHSEHIDELLNSLRIEPESEKNQDNYDDGLGESE
jgi:ribosome-binding factor A